MSYVRKAAAPKRHKKKGLLARVLGAFGDDAPSGGSCTSYDASGNCTSYDISDSGISVPSDSSGPVSSSSTSQDTTVLSSGAVVGGQATGLPTAGAVTGAWTTINGVCYATNAQFLEDLKDLQRAANRCAATAKPPLAKIGVDGQIGQNTLGLMSAIAKLGAFKGVASPTLTCYNVCQYAATFTSAMNAYADQAGAATSVSSPSPAASPQVYNAQTGKLEGQGLQASIGDAWKNLSSSEQMMTVGAVAAVGYWAYADHKKARRK